MHPTSPSVPVDASPVEYEVATCPWCATVNCPELFDHTRLDQASETTWRRTAERPSWARDLPTHLDPLVQPPPLHDSAVTGEAA